MSDHTPELRGYQIEGKEGGFALSEHPLIGMRPPLRRYETARAIVEMDHVPSVSFCYDDEHREELARLHQVLALHPLQDVWNGPTGQQRKNIIVRNAIRRRWEPIGVWNPSWGIPGSTVQPHEALHMDNTKNWIWPWDDTSDPDDPDVSDDPSIYDAKMLDRQEVVSQAFAMRAGRLHMQYFPLPPRSPLRPNASAAMGKAFLISRPWFQFQMDVMEEELRYDRLTTLKRWYNMIYVPRDAVQREWEARGDWGWHSAHPVEPSRLLAWSWPSEGFEAQFADLTPVSRLMAGADAAPVLAAMQFSAPELDAWMAVDVDGTVQALTQLCVHEQEALRRMLEAVDNTRSQEYEEELRRLHGILESSSEPGHVA